MSVLSQCVLSPLKGSIVANGLEVACGEFFVFFP